MDAHLVMHLCFCAHFVQAAMGTMDYIIDTISAVHSLMPLLGLLKLNGKLVTVGLPGKPLELPIFPLVSGNKPLTSNEYVLFCNATAYNYVHV